MSEGWREEYAFCKLQGIGRVQLSNLPLPSISGNQA